MACILTPDECFRKNVVARDLDLGLTASRGGWWSMRCPVGTHGRPLRLRAGDRAHIVYTDLGHCPELDIFKALITRKGFPRECLKRPKGLPGLPRSHFGEMDGKLADSILDVLFGEGTPTERMVRAAVLCLDGHLPEGPMCDVFADKLRVSPRTIYRATEERRRRDRSWS